LRNAGLLCRYCNFDYTAFERTGTPVAQLNASKLQTPRFASMTQLTHSPHRMLLCRSRDSSKNGKQNKGIKICQKKA
jgi:hypothetical protein